ncbi:succinate dehydrogenase/fumarate reductase iron-sulfur subunit [archaeon BMS3Bbin16]|nr:succinate dehydrogenase/fumarate reductase iron-sulfur subunit [archaeon BMS3Bbin16]
MNSLAEDIKQQVESEISSCRNCKKCLLACPLPESKGIDIFHLNREILSERPTHAMLDFAFLCYSCGACNDSCSEHLRRDLHMAYLRSKGRLPKGFTNLLHWRGRSLGPIDKVLYSLKRIKDRPVDSIARHLDKTEFKDTDLLFYFACYAYSPSNIPEKTLGIADHLGLDYDVIAGYSHCCGWPHFLAGDFDRAEPLFIDLFNTITNTTAKTVVTGCAECYKALKFIRDRYAGSFKVLTTTEWITAHQKKLKLTKSTEPITFHDSCQLSRLEDKADVPRALVKKMASLVEMEANRRETRCCGGMRAGHEPERLNILRQNRLTEAKSTGAKMMVTECITCYEKYHPHAKDIKVRDLSELVYDRLKK